MRKSNFRAETSLTLEILSALMLSAHTRINTHPPSRENA